MCFSLYTALSPLPYTSLSYIYIRPPSLNQRAFFVPYPNNATRPCIPVAVYWRGPLLFFLQTVSDTRSPFNSLLDWPCLQHDWPLLFKMHRFDFLHISPLSEFSLFFSLMQSRQNNRWFLPICATQRSYSLYRPCWTGDSTRNTSCKNQEMLIILSCDDDEPASYVANIISGELLKKLFFIFIKMNFHRLLYVFFFCQMESFFDCVYHWVNCY